MFLGIDSCRAGWFCVALDARAVSPVAGVFENIAQIVTTYPKARRVLIDIPIGLPVQTPRECDRLARQALGRRGSSVFSVPVRDAVYAHNYLQACEQNQRMLGKKLSKQTWNICPKIRAVDKFLRESPAYVRKLQEAHPELCFAALNEHHPMRHSKKELAGIRERLRVLQRYLPDARSFYHHTLQHSLRKAVARDDILDAMILAVTAAQSRLRRLPARPPRDQYGLPMQIVLPDKC